MNLTQVKAGLKLFWKLKHEGKIENLPIICLVGDTGIGKSTILKQICAEISGQDYYEAMFLAQMEVGDLIGMPTALDDRTSWLKPDWFPEEHNKGMLIFDEFGDSDTQVRKAIMPLLLTNKLHTHKLAQSVLIACAMNPIGGQFGGVGFTKQLKNRLMFWKVVSPAEEFIDYLTANNYPKYLINMFAEQPSLLEDQHDSNTSWQTSSEYDGMCTRRSVTTATQVLDAMDEASIKLFGAELLTAMIGPAAAATLLTHKHKKEEELIKVEELFTHTTKILTQIDAWVTAKEIGKLSAFTRMMLSYIKTKKKVADIYPKDGSLKPLGKMLEIIPEDMAAAFLKKISLEIPFQIDLIIALAKSNMKIYDRITAAKEATE